jgi:hypothetical protein
VTYEEICRLLEERSPREKQLFVCACAERVLGILEVLAQPQSTQFCRRALEYVWAGTSLSPTLVDDLSVLPEASIDDSNDPRYYAMLAMGLVNDALQPIDEMNETAPSASGGALDLASSIDYITKTSRLAGLEAQAQAATLQILQSNDIEAVVPKLHELNVSTSEAFRSSAAKLA